MKTGVFNTEGANANINIMKEGEHEHNADEEIIQQDRFKNSLRNEIVTNPTAPVKRVYCALLLEDRHGQGEYLPMINSVRATMNRQRSSLVPASPIPPTVNDVNIQGAWAETWTNEDFVLDRQNPIDVIILCTRDNLLRLSDCDTVYVDWSFRRTSHPYKQIFTIHRNYIGHVIHLVSCLLN